MHVDNAVGLSLVLFSCTEHELSGEKGRPLTADGAGPLFLGQCLQRILIILWGLSWDELELSKKNSRSLTAYSSCEHAYDFNP